MSFKCQKSDFANVNLEVETHIKIFSIWQKLKSCELLLIQKLNGIIIFFMLQINLDAFYTELKKHYHFDI